MEKRPPLRIGNVAGAAAGLLFGWYAGIFLLIPALAGLLWGWMLHKACKVKNGFLLWALAVQAGHVSWIVTGFIMMSAPPALRYAAEFAVVLFGLIWLYLHPGKKPVMFLSAYQISAFIMNALVLFSPMGAMAHKPLIVHMVLRLVAVVCMLGALKEMRKAGGR